MNVEFDKSENHLRIDATDHGLALTPEVLERLYSKFVRMIYAEREIEKANTWKR